MKKLIIRITLGIFALFLIWRVFQLIIPDNGKAGGSQGRPPVAVEIEPVKFGNIREIREFTGTIYPYYQYIIAPKVSGRVISIRKRIGDWVKKGEVIARIDNAEYEQSLREAEANLKIAQAGLIEAQSQFELARQELDRVQSLKEKGIASPSELDAASTNYTAQESRLKLARAQVEQREAALKSARIRLDYTVLAASEPGFIGERFVDEGALLSPNQSIASVIGIDTVFVRATIIERDYGRIHIGQPAEIQVDAFPSRQFRGNVYRLAPQLQEESRVAQMEIRVVNDSLILKPGMFAKVRVVLAEKENVQLVPGKALIRHNGTSGVFIIEAGESVAKYVPVETGIVTLASAEIISPILNGKVVTLGQHLLEDGSPITLPMQQAEPKQ
jgi:RND family efflux transporter MFP subunit